MTTKTRQRIVEGALAILRTGGAPSLESVARQVGLTKPGLMYHFPTKEALMLGCTDHVLDGYVASLTALLDGRFEDAGPVDRLRAYVDWSLEGTFDAADLVMLADPRVRTLMTQRWGDRLEPWLTLPDGLSDADRACLNAVRLMADGSWFADAVGFLPLDASGRTHLRATAQRLLEQVA